MQICIEVDASQAPSGWWKRVVFTAETDVFEVLLKLKWPRKEIPHMIRAENLKSILNINASEVGEI